MLSGICEPPRIPTPTCPFGTIQRLDGSCLESATPSTAAPCPPGKFLTASGSCDGPKFPTCLSGTIQKPDGSCETPLIPPIPKQCPQGTFLAASGSCEAPSPICPYGTIRSTDGTCERPIISSTLKPCPTGTSLTPFGSCEAPIPTRCPIGTIEKGDGSCERQTPRPCPVGTFLTTSGSCDSPNTPTSTCPYGTILSPDGNCKRPRPPSTTRTCPLGTHLTADGNCMKLEITTTLEPCPPGTFSLVSGICETRKIPSCPPGTFQVASGACEYPAVSSTTSTNYDYSKSCPPGTFETPAGLCEKPTMTTSTPQCPPGTYLTPSGSCEIPTRSSSPIPPPRSFETTASRDYLPPVTLPQYVPLVTQEPHQSSITPEKPFQSSATPQMPQVTSPRSFQPFITIEKPFQPSITPQIPSTRYYSSVTTPTPYKPSETTQISYQSSIPLNTFLTTPKALPPLIQCQNGTTADPSGSCIPKISCPLGSKISTSGVSCESFSTKLTTSFAPSYQTPYQKQQCDPGQKLSSSGICISPPWPTTTRPVACSFGQTLSQFGKCEETLSTSDYEYYKLTTFKPISSCGPNETLSPSGSCIYQPQSTPEPITTLKPSCKPGHIPPFSGFGCVYQQSPRKSSCKVGQILTSSGICIYPSLSTSQLQPSCNTGQILSSSGICTYPTSFEGTMTQKPISCPAGQIIAPSGNGCVSSRSTHSKQSCRPGEILSSTGANCEYPQIPILPTGIVTKPSKICSFGAKLSPIKNECITSPTGYEYPKPSTLFKPSPSSMRPSKSRQCSSGQLLSPSGVCIYSTPHPKPSSSCGPNQELSQSGSCNFLSRSTAKQIQNSKPSCQLGQALSSSGICIYRLPTTTPHPSEKPLCDSGKVLTSSGSCSYPLHSTLGSMSSTTPEYKYSIHTSFKHNTYAGSSTLSTGTSKQCSTGLCINLSKIMPIPQPEPLPSCAQGQILSASGSCIYISRPTHNPTITCLPGQVLSSTSSCIYPSEITPVLEPNTPPSCNRGQVLSDLGYCINLPQSTLGPILSTTNEYEHSKPSSVFIPSHIYSSTVRPTTSKQCERNQILSPSGSCIYHFKSTHQYINPTNRFGSSYSVSSSTKPTTLNHCAPGQILSSSGICIYSPRPIEPLSNTKPPCISGQMLSSTGRCIYLSQTPSPQSTIKSCGPGQTTSPTGSCIYPSQSTQGTFPSSGLFCKPGQELSASGLCTSHSSTTPQPTSSIFCKPGQILSTSGTCIYIPQINYTVSCAPGQVSQSGSCIYPPQFTASFPVTTVSALSEYCPPGSKPLAYGSGCQYSKPTTSSPTFGKITGYNYSKPSTPFTPKPQCPLAMRLGPSGACERPSVPTTTPRYDVSSSSLIPSKKCPQGSQLRPSGFCEQISTPPHVSIPSVTIKYKHPKYCPSGTVETPSGSCQSQFIPESPQCPPGTIPGPTATCEQISQLTPRPQCPFGSSLGSNGFCESSKVCPPGMYKTSTGDCKNTDSSTTIYKYTNTCPPNTIKISSGECKRTNTLSQRPTCPSGSMISSSGKCQYPIPTSSIPDTPTDTNNQFTPSYPTNKPYRPTTTTRPADGYIYNKPTPTFGYPSSTLIPNSNSINQVYVPSPTTYLPPDETEAGSNTEVRISHRKTTERPSDITGESINSVTRIVNPSIKQPVYNGEQNDSPPIGCAAALKCVQEIYCTADGFISPVPVVLTKDQEVLKVPTTVCKDEVSGIIGKCCRDPNYKDPWPSANLVNGADDGQYKEDNLYGQRSIGINRLVRSSNITKSSSRLVRNSQQITQESQPSCGERNRNTKPLGAGAIDANFAEFPWQAMILRDSNRSLLCGGAIIRKNAVLTTAHCVEGLDTSDVLIKGGEWKLGIDEEPLPFQIVKVDAILRHPGYKSGSYENDLAVLVLQEQLRPSKNIGTICLPRPNQIPTSNCIATGWGKRILQLHAKGAVMHHIKVNVMDSQECLQTLQQYFIDSIQNYSPNTLCGFSNIDQCKVDYGSALACLDDKGRYTLSGIYTWDTGCKQDGQIGGYVAPDVEWIDFTLTKSLKDLKKLEKEYLLKRRL